MGEAFELQDPASAPVDVGTTGGEGADASASVDQSQWETAFEALSGLDATRALDAASLEALGEAAWWLGRIPESIAARGARWPCTSPMAGLAGLGGGLMAWAEARLPVDGETQPATA